MAVNVYADTFEWLRTCAKGMGLTDGQMDGWNKSGKYIPHWSTHGFKMRFLMCRKSY
jgi:hypothetical protein